MLIWNDLALRPQHPKHPVESQIVVLLSSTAFPFVSGKLNRNPAKVPPEVFSFLIQQDHPNSYLSNLGDLIIKFLSFLVFIV
jgi:hypothetical protein